jgi:hypothetical protein
MARGDTLAESPKTFGGQEFFAFFKGNPVLEMRKRFQQNARGAAKVLKQEMVRIIKERHQDGQPGTGYNPTYARRKSRMTGRGYRPGQRHDYEWSGQLHDALEGRARAKPSKGVVNAWVGFTHLRRQPIQRTPGSNPNAVRTLNNRQLTEVLNRRHGGVGGSQPFRLTESEREELLRRTAKILQQRHGSV